MGAFMVGKIGKELENWLTDAKKVVIAGIGNPIRSDDYVGLKIVQDLQGKVSGNVCLLECETVPESYLLDIEEFKPTHVLLIDAAFLGLNPGEVRLVDSEKISDFPAITTHVLPLRIFCEYVKQATGAKIALLLIEPKSMEFGEGLTAEIQEAAEKVTKILLELLG
jgi:hydrogenase 3 maturation protease